MVRILIKIVLLIALANCMSEHQGEPIKTEPSANQEGSSWAPSQNVPSRPNLSPAARAAAPETTQENTTELMDCVTQSCKINCSPKVKKQWCELFKEPVE
jgi:hypothetical protein